MKSEKEIESRLVCELKKVGADPIKFVPFHLTGMPDRLVLIPGGKVVWVELKQQGERPRPIQTYRMERLKELGFECFVVDDEHSIRQVVAFVKDKKKNHDE